MNLVWAAVIVVIATGLAVSAMLLVRRSAPEGGYFADGDRAAGVFGVLATGFSVLLGFIVFLAFTSYDTARSGAETEALIVAQQVETAQLLPPEVAPVLTGQLVCYARSVAGPQWEKMEQGSLGDELNPWGIALFRTLQTIDPQTPAQAAYSQWLDQRASREEARQARIHGVTGVIPVPLWIVLFFISGVIFVFMLFFADRGERVVVQGVLMGSVVAVITATMLLLLLFLNNPFHSGVGGLKPTAMKRTLVIIDQQLEIVGRPPLPCDDRGIAL